MDVLQSIQNGTAWAVIVGSFKNGHGAAGYMIICPTTEAHYTGRHTIRALLPRPTAPTTVDYPGSWVL
jgi:hypothetical protein